MSTQMPFGQVPDVPEAAAAVVAGPLPRDAGGTPRRILIAVDAGGPADRAVRTGAALARALGARVRVIHVLEPELGLAEDFVTAQRLEAQHRRDAEALLAGAAAALSPAVEVETVLRDGGRAAAAGEIIAAAREWPADLVVIGTRGRGRLAELLLGSTADAVVRGAPCPVVTVGQSTADAPPGAAGQAAGRAAGAAVTA